MDYFDALLRAAGLGAAETSRPAGPHAEAADLVEVDQEVALPEAATGGVVGDEPSPAAPISAAGEPDAPPAADAVSPAPVRAEQGARREAIAALTPQPPSPQGSPSRHAEAAMHPMVQAALQWVAGDPQIRAERTAVDANVPAARAVPAAPQRHATRTTAARQESPVDAEEAAPDPRRGRRPASPETPPAPLSRSVDTAPRQRPAARDAEPAGQRLAPDVHIGAIHVTVDAPRPPVAPVAPIAAPPLPAPAARSDFLRSRAPRL